MYTFERRITSSFSSFTTISLQFQNLNIIEQVWQMLQRLRNKSHVKWKAEMMKNREKNEKLDKETRRFHFLLLRANFQTGNLVVKPA